MIQYAEIHLFTIGIGDTIKINIASNQDHAKAMIFICHYLHEGMSYREKSICYLKQFKGKIQPLKSDCSSKSSL